MAYEDITKTGTKGLKGLPGVNTRDPFKEYLNTLRGATPRQYVSATNPETYEYVGKELAYTDYGNSIYDKDITSMSQARDINEFRAQSQSSLAKLGAGLGKGVALAGTTFLDGTLGLIVGVPTAIKNGDISKLWDNEISNGLNEFNKKMEEWLPNYRTREELESPWYANLGTVNFWADSVLKNLGFTIGALYSGGVWTKALKGIKLLKDTSTLGAKLTGTLFSSVNEARIESNHLTNNLRDLKVQQASDAAAIKRGEIKNNPYLSEEEKRIQLDIVNKNYDKALLQIDEDLKKAGLTNFLIQVPILSASNFWTFGRMYAQGFQNAKNVTADNVKKNFFSRASQAANEAAAAAENTLAQQTKKQGSKFIWDAISKKKAIGKGLLTGLIEGNEELAQALSSEFAGNLYSYKDSPDTYYRAMTDPKALQETTDAWAALATSFANTYGNGDRYEEFAVGFLTGILGVPTFGKSQNASANTWIGRGKVVGISGGIMGELATAKEENEVGKAHVELMNKLYEKVQKNKGIMVASKKYTDAMHAWAVENDAFEYKNQEDNEDWRAITSFLSTGRKDDLLSLIDQDFENATDEELEAIAVFTTPDGSNVGSGGWRDASGNLITADSAQEDKDKMREKLAEKRDKIKKTISEYEKSLSLVRNLVNGSKNVKEDEVNELAWLHWKMGRFSERYNEVIDDSKNKEAYRSLDSGLQSYEDALKEQIAEKLYDTSDLTGAEKARLEGMNLVTKERIKAAENTLQKVQKLRMFLQSVVTSKGNRQLTSARDLKANLEVLDNLMKDDALYDNFLVNTAIPREELNEALRQLQDLGRLSEAFVQFNKRFSEFTQDPNKLRANRKKIDEENAEIQDTIDSSAKRKKARNISVEEIKSKDNDELDDILNSLDENNPNDEDKINAVKAEINKRKTGEAIRNKLRDLEQAAMEDEDIDTVNAIQAALTKLEEAQAEADNAEELLDLDNEIYHGLGQLESQDSALEDEAFSQLSQAMDSAIKEMEESSNMKATDEDQEKNEETGKTITPAEKATTPSTRVGHDPVETTPAINSPKKRKTAKEINKEKQDKKKAKKQKYKNKQQEKSLKERRDQLIVSTTTEVLKQLSSEIDITEDIFAKALDLVSRVFTELENADTSEENIISIAKKLSNQDEWKDFKEAINLPVSEDLLLFTIKYLDALKNNEEEQGKKDTPEDREKRVGPTTQTPDIDIDSEDFKQLDWSPINLGSWMSLIREYPIHGKDTTPYHQSEAFKAQLRNKLIQKGLKNKELEDAFNAEVKRLTAVYDYLKKHNAFSNAAKVKASKGRQSGTKIHFVVDPILNANAGEVVILMSTDPEGKNIVGAVRGNNEIVSEQFHLQSFIDRTVEAFKKESDIKTIWASSETTHVAQVLPGRVMFSNKSYSLNEIYSKGTDINSGVEPFMLGIYMSNTVVMSSRAKKGNRTKLEMRAKTPYKGAVNGQPFLMVPTGEGVDKYIPVPIHMNLFSSRMSSSKFAQFVREHINEVLDNKLKTKKTQLAIKLALEDLFAHQFHVNVQGDVFKIAATMQDGVQRNILEAELKKVNLSTIISALENAGLGIQINRKYINDTITLNGKEVNYNEIIGELAATNIAPGFGHTVNDFFTLNPINENKKEEKANKLEDKKEPINEDSKSDKTSKTQVTVNKTVYYLKSDGNITDAAGKVISVDSDTLVKIKASAEIINENLVSINSANPTIYHTTFGYYDIKKSTFINSDSIEDGSSNEVVTPENISDYIQITNTNNGMSSIYPINSWNRKVKDLRKDIPSPGGWGTHAGLTFYIQFRGGRVGDNVAIWFKNSPSPNIKKQIELFFEKSATINERILADILNGKVVYTDSSTDADNTSSRQTEVPSTTTTVERNTDIEDDTLSSEDIAASMSDRSEGTKVKTFSFGSKKTDSTEAAKPETSGIPRLFNTTKELKEIFNALSFDQQEAVRELNPAMQRQVMIKLKKSYKNGKFDVDPDTLIKPTRHRIAENKRKQSNLEKELEWLDKVLPQLSREQKVAIVEGLIKVSESPTPLYAWGKFQNGIITLSRKAAKGTVYHEAFHFVSQTLLSDRELDTLYAEGAEKYKIQDVDEIEERLAEDYRKYVQLEQIPILGSAVKIFRKLKHRVQAFVGNESYISNLFYRISNGEFSNKKTPTLEKPNSTSYERTKERLSTAETEEMKSIKAAVPTKEEMISAVQNHVNNYIVESYNRGYTSKYNAVNRWGLLVDNYQKRGFIIKAKNPTLRGRLDFTITDVTFSPELKAAMRIRENIQKKFGYKYLNSQQKAFLNAQGISEWTYNTMTTYEKEEFWRCRR